MKAKHWILSTLTPLVIVGDQLTKRMVLDQFRLGEAVPVVDGYFSLTYVRNTGAAFGLLANADPAFRVPFFLAVPVVALVAIWAIFRKLPANDLRLAAALSLVIGGAVGNLIDRIAHGFVVDFLLFYWRDVRNHFPAFNVADSAICVGVGLMMLDMFVAKKPAQAEAPSAGDARAPGGRDAPHPG